MTKPVLANVSFESSFADNGISISTTTKLFQNLKSGKIYIGAFIVESDVTHIMEENEVVEHAMLRTVAGTETPVLGGYLWIDEIFNTGSKAGATMDHYMTATLESSWNQENLEVIVVLWLIDGDSVSVINCQNVPYQAVSVQKLVNNKPEEQVTVIPGQNRDIHKIKLPYQWQGHKSIEIFNVNGKKVFSKLFNSDENEFFIKTNSMSSGMYVININMNGKKLQRSFIKQ